MRLCVTLRMNTETLENSLKSLLMGWRGGRAYQQQVRRSVYSIRIIKCEFTDWSRRIYLYNI